MKLKSFGCSFIYGTDLSDSETSGSYSHMTWPALLAARFDLPYRCYAGGGHGNLSILDRLSHEIYRDPGSLFVIQWTYIDRFDYSDPNGVHFNKAIINDWLTIRPASETPQSEFFFREIHSEYRDKLTNLIYMKMAIDLLRENNCKFFMTCLDKLVLCSEYHVSHCMKEWQKYLLSNMVFFEGKDFLSWSNHQRFPTGKTSHPLEEAHAAASDLMAPVIDAILHKA